MKRFRLVSLFLLTAANVGYAATPQDFLADNQSEAEIKGVVVRKGTIAASIRNILELDKLLMNKGAKEQIAKIFEEQRPLSKGLWATDLLEVLSLDAWISDEKRPGRIAAAALIVQACPQLATPSVRSAFQKVLAKSHPMLKAEIEKALKS